MTFPDITADLKSRAPKLRGRLLPNEPLAPLTWFRVGGPADVIFLPEDQDDLAVFLKALPKEAPVTVLGVGSNTLVRDGGVEGVVIRLGRGFNQVEANGATIKAGSAVPDAILAKKAAEAGIAGLEAEAPPAVRSEIFEAVKQQLPDGFEWSDPFGAAVEVPAEAPALDRLVAISGRSPRWPES